ncbi:MAG TPA: VOC family protein [Acidimicrobiales bacterium]|nr:VOC family protein [Acidimicrobiales bacterium]
MAETATQATRKPRFNHVAMSVPSELLQPAGRKELCDFYGDVFGWQELPTETIDGKRLVFGVHHIEQFVFLIADDPPMSCPRLDHFGLSVATEQELDEILSRAKAHQAQDPRVEIIDKEVTDHKVLSITSIYVRFLLPMMVEVQWWRFAEGGR